ncbi:MAG: hypothetical protein GW938_07560 [Leptospira sp.]|nr:hypothetical protein [Leptospira sp.]
MNKQIPIDIQIDQVLNLYNEELESDPIYISLTEANENFKRMVKNGTIVPRESQAKSILDTHLVSFKINGKY